ncbi:MAG: energy-coupling factor transporter transmembrane protein EcfT [Desulfamplus sp.]|nr:energy-coupling factor transporter transmembrane protein EcfT [Desulfamplus sp.]MBF0241202.1 energy-coupling factor transporter transmembrane protein EcfT [Desulfamplus sp.]MBF0389932.1 energy-coupling factor transporter transmembrane protein EcfT [Desulfamplus sp.]
MGRVTQFSYRKEDFALFQLDVRCKIICICSLSVAITKADFLHLFVISAALLWLIYRSNLKILIIVKELKYFFFMLFFIVIVRGFTTSGEPISIYKEIYITKEGIIDGAKISWRFLSIMFMGLLFSCSTQSASLKNAVMWFLKPIPFIPEKKRVGVMVSLFVRFLPLIMDKASEVSDAQKSRCSHLQKNPIKRIKNIATPLLQKVFHSADKLIIAMESRCYNANRPEVNEHHFLRSGYEEYFYVGTALLAFFTIFI